MSKDKRTYRSLSEEEIRDYLNGNVTGKAAHELERHLLNDTFDKEAVEGFGEFKDKDLAADLRNLKNRVESRSQRSSGNWLKVAATVALLVVSVSVVWYFIELSEKAGTEVALKNEETTTSENFEVPSPKSAIPPTVTEQERSAPIPEKQIPPAREESAEIVMEEDVQITVPPVEPGEELALESRDVEVELDAEILEEDIAFNAVEGVASGYGEAKEDRAADAPTIRIRGASALKKSIADGAGSNIGPLAGVSGTVTDETGEPLPGVNVVIKGTSVGTVTDIEGNYQINFTDEDAILQFSFIGMQSAEAPVADKSVVNMELETDVASLSEVVVVGYGVERRSSVTGAVSVVDTKDLENNFEKPEPEGGLSAFKKYLENELVYPAEAREKEVEGKVILKLMISSSGSISDIEVRRSLGYGCDEEAIRLVEDGPEWKAARRNDTPIESTVRVKVKFELEN